MNNSEEDAAAERWAALKPSDQALLTALRQRCEAPVAPAPVGPIDHVPTAPAHQAQDDAEFREMMELIRCAGL
jgi:hypothetical protein